MMCGRIRCYTILEIQGFVLRIHLNYIWHGKIVFNQHNRRLRLYTKFNFPQFHFFGSAVIVAEICKVLEVRIILGIYPPYCGCFSRYLHIAQCMALTSIQPNDMDGHNACRNFYIVALLHVITTYIRIHVMGQIDARDVIRKLYACWILIVEFISIF